jgi:predicted phosphoribosyltransferase
LTDPLVVGIGAGGLAVAAVVASTVGAELDLLIVAEIDVEDPNHPPIQVGAVGGGGELVLHEEETARLSPLPGRFEEAVERARSELSRLEAVYRPGAPPRGVAGRDVVVVDDGTSSRTSLRAAAEIVRQDGPRTLVVAIPEAPREVLSEVEPVADVVLCAEELPWYTWFRLHGRLYQDPAVPEEPEVRRLLSGAGRPA